MKNFKKIVTMALAAVMAVSAMSVSAMAEENEKIPTLAEVDLSVASKETPVKYIDEKTGTIVTIFDPDVRVYFDMPMQRSSDVLVEGKIYVPMASEKLGMPTESFVAPKNGTTSFVLTNFRHDRYNISLNKMGPTGAPASGDTTLALLEGKPTDSYVALGGVKSGSTYYYRLSSWLGGGNADYVASM